MAFTWESVLENNINYILGPHLTVQAQMTFTWESVLENNINYILGPHLTV